MSRTDIADVTVVAWNTGRKYGPGGQRMAAAVLPDGRAAFVDLDRHIDGTTNVPINPDRLRSEVMWHYDLGQYRCGIRFPDLRKRLEAAAGEACHGNG